MKWSVFGSLVLLISMVGVVIKTMAQVPAGTLELPEVKGAESKPGAPEIKGAEFKPGAPEVKGAAPKPEAPLSKDSPAVQDSPKPDQAVATKKESPGQAPPATAKQPPAELREKPADTIGLSSKKEEPREKGADQTTGLPDLPPLPEPSQTKDAPRIVEKTHIVEKGPAPFSTKAPNLLSERPVLTKPGVSEVKKAEPKRVSFVPGTKVSERSVLKTDAPPKAGTTAKGESPKTLAPPVNWEPMSAPTEAAPRVPGLAIPPDAAALPPSTGTGLPPIVAPAAGTTDAPPVPTNLPPLPTAAPPAKADLTPTEGLAPPPIQDNLPLPPATGSVPLPGSIPAGPAPLGGQENLPVDPAASPSPLPRRSAPPKPPGATPPTPTPAVLENPTELPGSLPSNAPRGATPAATTESAQLPSEERELPPRSANPAVSPPQTDQDPFSPARSANTPLVDPVAPVPVPSQKNLDRLPPASVAPRDPMAIPARRFGARDMVPMVQSEEIPATYPLHRKKAEAEAAVQRILQGPKPWDRKMLEQKLTEAFEARQEILRVELAHFQARLTQLNQQVQLRDQQKKRIIDQRLAELENPHLQWDPALVRSPSSGMPTAFRPGSAPPHLSSNTPVDGGPTAPMMLPSPSMPVGPMFVPATQPVPIGPSMAVPSAQGVPFQAGPNIPVPLGSNTPKASNAPNAFRTTPPAAQPVPAGPKMAPGPFTQPKRGPASGEASRTPVDSSSSDLAPALTPRLELPAPVNIPAPEAKPAELPNAVAPADGAPYPNGPVPTTNPTGPAPAPADAFPFSDGRLPATNPGGTPPMPTGGPVPLTNPGGPTSTPIGSQVPAANPGGPVAAPADAAPVSGGPVPATNPGGPNPIPTDDPVPAVNPGGRPSSPSADSPIPAPTSAGPTGTAEGLRNAEVEPAGLQSSRLESGDSDKSLGNVANTPNKIPGAAPIPPLQHDIPAGLSSQIGFADEPVKERAKDAATGPIGLTSLPRGDRAGGSKSADKPALANLQGDLGRWQGEWRLVRGELSGRAMTPAEQRAFSGLRVEGNRVTMFGGDLDGALVHSNEGVLEINSFAKIKEFNLAMLIPTTGIYDFRDEQLWISLYEAGSKNGETRPGSFATKTGSLQRCYVFEKKKIGSPSESRLALSAEFLKRYPHFGAISYKTAEPQFRDLLLKTNSTYSCSVIAPNKKSFRIYLADSTLVVTFADEACLEIELKPKEIPLGN